MRAFIAQFTSEFLLKIDQFCQIPSWLREFHTIYTLNWSESHVTLTSYMFSKVTPLIEELLRRTKMFWISDIQPNEFGLKSKLENRCSSNGCRLNLTFSFCFISSALWIGQVSLS